MAMAAQPIVAPLGHFIFEKTLSNAWLTSVAITVMIIMLTDSGVKRLFMETPCVDGVCENCHRKPQGVSATPTTNPTEPDAAGV